MSKQASSIPSTDLVIIIDTSPSIKDEAQALSNAATSAIASAKSSCPSELRVVWLGIEGTWKGTNFDQTIRGYLTQKLMVPESKPRSRKRGELKSAGAQEDAARAIEDISDYFDWREGAARAIFYLGDEALEGGGDKTEQEDIEAADLAIQKAQVAGVTVHTYFGTSKSKHQEGIKAEYARVATSTGGQAFTDRDAISGFSAVLEKVICGSRTAKTIKLKPGAVYVQDCVTNELSKLYTLDLDTGKATLIGEIVTEVADIAFVGSQLYGLDRNSNKTQLIKIDLNSGSTTVVGNIGFAAAGLAYNRQRQTLYATTAKQLIAINLETGKGTPVATVADKNYNCGEVAFDADGRAYVTLIGYDKKKLLVSCNIDTGRVNTIGNIGFAALASMEFVGDALYGVTGKFFNLGKDGQVIRINTTTGQGTLVATTDPIGRWAGITIYEPATVATMENAPEVSGEKSGTTKPQEIEPIKEENMSILTIDTKNNCYVIDPNQMNNLQQNVASTFTFDKGTFDIRITGGRYRHVNTEAEGSPSIIVWVYGVDGSTFINKATGNEIGATWTTLNGYNDSLKLEVKEKAVLCALFFDISNTDNSGIIDLLITSDKPFFNPRTLTVDSKRNCYVLDEAHLSSLKQLGSNLVELAPGNYQIKIRESNASYWTDNKKFNLEPWALIWVRGGKFIPKLTGIEVEETWCSLNGLQDEVVLEVKEKTTLTGLFFDTYKEDNQGKIILAIEPVSANELIELYKKQENNQVKEQKQEETITTETVTNIAGTGGAESRETITNIAGTSGAESRETITNIVGSEAESRETVTNIAGTTGAERREAMGVNNSMDFTFRFNEDELKKKWEEQLQQISASIKVADEGDVTLEAKYWDQLEQWLLKNYEKHFKNLAIEVAKVRFTMDAYIQQMEFSLNQQLQGWSGYLDTLLQERINVEVSKRINQQINQYFDQTFEQKIRNNIGVIVNNIVNKQELNQYIDQHVNQQIDQIFEGKISNNINAITQSLVKDNTELERYVSRQIDNTYEQKIQNRIQVITRNIVNNNEELNQYVERRLQQTVANNTEVNNEIVNIVANSTEINNKIDNLRNEWSQTFISLATEHVDELSNIISGRETFNRVITQKLVTDNTELEQYVSRQIDNTYEQKMQDRIQVITRNIVNNNEELNQYIDRRFQQAVANNTEVNNEIMNLVVNSTEINNKINNVYKDVDTKIENIRNEWNQTFISLISQYVDELIDIIGERETFNIRIANSINIKVNELLSQIMRTKNELTVLMNNADRNLFEWTLGELMAIKGCLTDRQALVEQVVSFSAELRTKLDSAPCVDIKSFKPFNPNLIEPKQQQQLPGS